MPKRKKDSTSTTENGATLGHEGQLWQVVDALRGSMDAAEYKHVVPGLIFLKGISDAFEGQQAKLLTEREDPDEYCAVGVLWAPSKARWSYLQAQAKQPEE